MDAFAPAPADPPVRSAPLTAAGELAAVLFDMDGVLIDSEPLWFEVECDIMARLGGTWSRQDQHALVGGSLRSSVDYLLARATRPSSREEVERWLVGGMADLLSGRDLAVMPGALELLAQVRAAGLPAALVTSSEREIMEVVTDRLGVSFPVTVCGGDVANGKPHPEPYQRAMDLIGAGPRWCVAVEDSPNGVASAQQAGCAVVAVPGVAPVPPAPRRTIVSSLTQVDLPLLRSLVT